MRYLHDRLGNGHKNSWRKAFFLLNLLWISLTLIATWKTPSTCPQAVVALAESSREKVKAVERFMILVCFTEVLNSIVIVFS